MTRHHLINGIQVPFTAEEEAQRDAEELAWNNGAKDRAIVRLREKRNRLLASSDWKVVMAKEKGTTLSAGWKAWRQELRDLPGTITDSDTAETIDAKEFPVEP